MNNTSVDSYLAEGCGRCDKFRTPDCKVNRWTDALAALLELVRETELVEEMKWGSPCYTLGGKNVLMVVTFNDYCGLSFFKGAAIEDDEGALEAPGPNTRFARVLKFRSAAEVAARRALTQRIMRQAIEVERAGVELVSPCGIGPIPPELAARLAVEDELRQAFEALTPGRQRSHILHIGGARRPSTRDRRVDRCTPKILAGKGFNER